MVSSHGQALRAAPHGDLAQPKRFGQASQRQLREDAMAEDWWRGSVTYQTYPRSFEDSNGDGVGDLPGITQRLPQVADLGVDAVWLSPVFRSPMVVICYDVGDHRDIDPLFG